MQTAANFFTEEEKASILGAITEAESHTSGEIRLHLETLCLGNEVAAAWTVFRKLGMHETKERNGVLIYLATLSRKVAIVGDEGIHAKLGSAFWEEIVARLIKELRADHKAEGLCEAIRECGKQLGKFFPLSHDDKNELSNEISY